VKRFLAVDERLSARLRVAEKPGALRTAAVLLGHSGDSWFWLAGLAILYFTGPDYWKYRALVMAMGIVLTAVAVMAIKFTVRRKRPEGELGQIYRRTDPHSFPSGHAARAVMLAVVEVGLGPTWLGILLVVWAAAVVLARVLMGVHYLSDVLAGALLGGLMGVVVLLLTAGWLRF
jgi:undecaprenyl-diphosphatase